jgi:hypothetical protein
MLEAAHAYLDRGVSILPLQPGNKRSFGRWKMFQRSPMGHDVAESWWGGKLDPMPGIGVITGPVSGDLTVLDIEPENVAFARDAINLPDTAMTVTARGGLHVYCHGATRCGKLTFDGHPLGDIRGRGGYVVAPPTETPHGAYQWRGPDKWDVDQLAGLPDWVTPPPSYQTPTELFTPSESARSGLLDRLPGKVQLIVTDPINRLSNSERHWWIVCEAIFAGASYEDVEDLFLSHPIGAYILQRELDKGDGGYLARTYERAYAAVQQQLAQSAWVRVHQLYVVDGLSANRHGPVARKRVLLEVFRPRRPEIYACTMPMVLADGRLSGEWIAFCRAFGMEPTETPMCPQTRGRAILDGNEVRRFIDGEVWR